MAKFLIRASYSDEGVKGILKEGGSKRQEAVAQAAAALGGSLESFYFAFGETDAFIVVDLPDVVAATIGSLVANAAGTAKVTYIPLITVEEVDQAAEKGRQLAAAYRPPGQ